jgi:hypothetical protein
MLIISSNIALTYGGNVFQYLFVEMYRINVTKLDSENPQRSRLLVPEFTSTSKYVTFY